MSELDLIKQITNLQRQVDGLIKPEVGRWMDWTPTVTQLGAVAVTVAFARYKAKDDLVTLEAVLAVTGTGTIANAIVISGLPLAIRPINAASNLHTIGTMNIVDTTAGLHFVGALVYVAADEMRGIRDNTGVFIGQAFALANGDFIGFNAFYER